VPELPETETIARGLDELVRDAVIRAVAVPRADVLREATAVDFAARTTGATIQRCWRRAKCIVLDLSTGDRIVVTPRFTGGLFVERRGAAPTPSGELPTPDYTAVAFTLGDGRTLRYRDVRRLGTVALMAPERFADWSGAIGPEPLDPELTANGFSGFIRSSRRAIKTVLMDQRRLAGVGNIYANEALWAARIAPTRSAARVTVAEAGVLLAELRRLLTASIAVGGTTFRDYRDPLGNRGGFAAQLQVYGREGAPCPRCGGLLRSHHKLEGRATVWCRECQR
jgi:formamidopyrimidine-DNA glycosylase